MKRTDSPIKETCGLCGCALLRRSNTYATRTVAGRRHASLHHLHPRRHGKAEALETVKLCYECHEEWIMNPVFTLQMIRDLHALLKERKLTEEVKGRSRSLFRDRVKLLTEVIETGLHGLLKNKAERIS